MSQFKNGKLYKAGYGVEILGTVGDYKAVTGIFVSDKVEKGKIVPLILHDVTPMAVFHQASNLGLC